jgi:hypothetical protein
VRINPGEISGEIELLKAVLGNRGIRRASLPYPLELQGSVDKLLAEEPDLRIRRTNADSLDSEKEDCDKIVQARIKAHSNAQ